MSASFPIVLLLLAAAAGDGSAPPAAEAKQEDRQVCRTAPATGSRLRRTRICMTAREWEIHQQAQQQDLSRRPALDRGQ